MRTNHYEAPYQISGRRTVFTVIGIVLCSIILLISVFFIVVSVKDFNKGEIPFFFGWGLCSADGVSDYTNKNDLVLIQRVSPEEIQEGDVLVYYDAASAYDRKVFTGKVTDKEGDIVELSTKEGSESVSSVNVGDIKGAARYSIGSLGIVLAVVEGKYGLILSIALSILFISIIILLFGSYFSQKEEKRMLLALENASDEIEQFTLKYSEKGLPGRRSAALSSASAEEEEEEGIIELPPLLQEEEGASAPGNEEALLTGEEPKESPPEEDVRIEPLSAKGAEAPVPQAAIEEALSDKKVYEPALRLEVREPAEAVLADTEAEETSTLAVQPEEISEPPIVFEPVLPEADAPELSAAEPLVEAGEEAPEEMLSEEPDREETPEEPAKPEEPEAPKAEEGAGGSEEDEDSASATKYSTINGSLVNEKVEFTIDCSQEEGEALRKLISLAVEKSGRFGIFTSAGTVDGYRLKIWCEWDDMPFVSTIIKEFKKRK